MVIWNKQKSLENKASISFCIPESYKPTVVIFIYQWIRWSSRLWHRLLLTYLNHQKHRPDILITKIQNNLEKLNNLLSISKLQSNARPLDANILLLIKNSFKRTFQYLISVVYSLQRFLFCWKGNKTSWWFQLSFSQCIRVIWILILSLLTWPLESTDITGNGTFWKCEVYPVAFKHSWRAEISQ